MFVAVEKDCEQSYPHGRQKTINYLSDVNITLEIGER